MDRAGRKVVGVFVAAFASVLLIALAEVPFRGEHWAFLQQLESESWWKLSSFVTFGPSRVQPLNFLPLALSYYIFGFQFVGHYTVSILLHLFFAYQCAAWLGESRASREIGFTEVIKQVPLELVLFVSLFVAFDVYTWTFFQYIQVAAVLAVSATRFFFRSRPLPAYLCAFAACLFYEPFIVLPVVFLVMRARQFGKVDVISLVPLVALLILYGLSSTGASAPVSVPPSNSELFGMRLDTGHDRLFLAAYAAAKPLFLVYNLTLFLWNTVRAIVWFCVAHRVNIYEMPSAQESIGTFLPMFSFLTFAGAVLFFSLVWRRRKYVEVRLIAFSAAVFLLFFSMVCLGRPEAGLYSSVQFRYAYLLSPFLLVPFFDLGNRLLRRPGTYRTALVFFICVNTASCLYQGVRLRNDMRVLTDYVKDLKAHGAPPDLIVADIAHGMRGLRWRPSDDAIFLIYNGRGGL